MCGWKPFRVFPFKKVGPKLELKIGVVCEIFKILLLLGKFEVFLCFSVLVDCWYFLKNTKLCVREDRE